MCPDFFGDGRNRAKAALFPRWPLFQARNFLGLLTKIPYLRRTIKVTSPKGWEEKLAPNAHAAVREVLKRHEAASGRPSALSMCGIGFCWGAMPVAMMLQSDAASKLPCPVTCAIAFHPALHGDFGALLDTVTVPYLLAPAGNDPPNVQPGGECDRSLSARFSQQPPCMAAFPKMLHGWMTRGPLTDPEIAAAYDEGLKLAVDFFDKQLGKISQWDRRCGCQSVNQSID